MELNAQKIYATEYTLPNVAKVLASKLANQTGVPHTTTKVNTEEGVRYIVGKTADVEAVTTAPVEVLVPVESVAGYADTVDTSELATVETVENLANDTDQVVTFPDSKTVRVSIPFLKETKTCLVGVDCRGTRRWFDKQKDNPVRMTVDGVDRVIACTTKTRAKQKGFSV